MNSTSVVGIITYLFNCYSRCCQLMRKLSETGCLVVHRQGYRDLTGPRWWPGGLEIRLILTASTSRVRDHCKWFFHNYLKPLFSALSACVFAQVTDASFKLCRVYITQCENLASITRHRKFPEMVLFKRFHAINYSSFTLLET